MHCEECGRELKKGDRAFEVTVGWIEEDPESETFFEPSETTYHMCSKCMGEEEEED